MRAPAAPRPGTRSAGAPAAVRNLRHFDQPREPVAGDSRDGPDGDESGAKDLMMARCGFGRIQVAVAALALLTVAPGARAALTGTFPNGIRATVHDAAETAAMCVAKTDGSRTFVHPVAGVVPLAAATRTLYPFDAAVVLAALGDMHGFATDLDVEVFVLDGIPAETGCSFARRGAIFLSPSYAPVDAAITAYIATHEMGHVLTWAFLDGQPGRWEAYAALRGLDLAASGPDAPHASRAREIVAEDFRYLFGGTLATRGIGLENHDLATPDTIDGLSDLLAGYLSGTSPVTVATTRAFPNPCNPRTTIELVLPAGVDGAAAELAIYDVRGQLVRRLQGDGAANGRVTATWDGTDAQGRAVPSGRYLYTIGTAQASARGAVTLVR